MNAATEFDLGPLTWVKGEIDLALERADEALRQYAVNRDATQLKFCRTHIHQVHGALAIVGLDGVTQITEAFEALLQGVEEGKYAFSESAGEVVNQTLLALRQYLDDLMAGEPNQPMRLLPVYHALAKVRGLEPPRSTDLFFPDLSLRPPKRTAPTAKPPADALKSLLKTERARFQKGLLAWLKKPEEAQAGLELMRTALRNVEATQDSPAARSFWWVSLGFLESLAERGPSAALEARQLCARIDLQIRRLLEGQSNVAERLMRDALYYVAQAPEGGGGVINEVRSTYRLSGLVADTTGMAPALSPHEASLRRLREVLSTAEEQWNKFCAGSSAMLNSFVELARNSTNLANEIGHTDLKRLAQGLAAIANWLSDQPSRQNDTVAMEVATAILLLQNAQENFKRLGTDFAQQVDAMVARLYGCISGNMAGPDAAIPLLDDMTRRAQEKLLISQVAREIQNNLAQIEQALDGFFRDPGKEHDLAQLEGPLRQIAGALTMLGHLDALASLRRSAEQIKHFSEAGYTPVDEDFQSVAQELSIIGFFVDSLQHGNADFEKFARKLRGEAVDDEEAGEDDDAAVAAPTVEVQLEQQKKETQALVEALKDKPEDLQLKDELKQNLQTLSKDADLVADRELGETAKAALNALELGDVSSLEVDAALASIKPAALEAPAPSAETLQLAQSSHEEIDAELLSIFLEEANEVLGTFAETLGQLEADPHDIESLTTLRRATHTLKGSGRMVGLTDLGETAWSVEQTLNLWLRQELALSPEMFDMLHQEHAVFSHWVRHFEDSAVPAPNPAALIALAERLRTSLEAPSVIPPVAPQPAPLVMEEELAEAASSPETDVELSDQLPEPAFSSTQTIELPVPEESNPAPAEVIEIETVLPETWPEDLELDASEAILEDLSAAEELNFPGPAEPVEMPDPLEAPADDTVGEPVVAEFEASPAPLADAPPLGVTSSPTLYDIFREEARGHLATLIEQFSLLETNPQTPTTFEFTRAAHTLGGIAATVGLMPINKVAITLEHALLRRDGSTRPDSLEGLETVRQAIVTLEDMFAALSVQRAPEPQPAMIEALEDIYPLPLLLQEEHPEEESPSAPDEAVADSSPLPELAQETSEGISAPRQPEMPLLQDELDDELLPIFLEEAQDLVRGFDEQLRAWRSNPADTTASRALTRLLHTFKGGARMAGAMNLGEMTHGLETRVEAAIKTGNASLSLIDELEVGCDTLAQAIEHLLSGESPTPAETEFAAGEGAPEGGGGQELTVQDSGSEPGDVDGGIQRPVLRVRADLIDRLVNEAGELSISRTRIEGEMRGLKSSLLDLTENVIRLRRQLRDIEIQAEGQIQARVAQTHDGNAEFDPLELDRFTRFQELTRFMAESVNDVATVQQTLLKNLDDANAAIVAQGRLNRGLQQELMGIRMMPFSSQAERLYRIVRQTSKELGKRANLDIRGGQVELDRSVLDKMLAPLEHMLRNAVKHGIESRSERLAGGKSEVGEITLSLAQEGNEIILTMADDGGGLHTSRIRRRAEEMGLLAPGQVLDDAALFDFIFQPGFSTADEVTQIAGRGVGMDVVKTEVSELGGRIETVSLPGEGTSFRVYLPLTLAMTQTLLVRAGSQLYAVPSNMIEQVQELKEKSLAALREKGEAEWMSNRYPFHFLPHLLGDTQALPEAHRRYWVLLLRSGTQRIAVQVDELKGNQEVVVKNIGAQLSRVVGIAGATVLGDGQVVLILNPVALASRTPVVTVQSAIPTAPAPVHAAASTLPTVLVVDDSLTVRKIVSRLLTREGYQVLLAKDGVDALEQLIEVLPDVVISDIEMPRMDGFDFVRNLRADSRLKNLPVIMITSRTADKHRNYALEIGANQYLGKPYNEDELLGLIDGYIKAGRTV